MDRQQNFRLQPEQRCGGAPIDSSPLRDDCCHLGKCVRVSMRAYMRVCLCGCACLRVCECVCVTVCVCARAPVCNSVFERTRKRADENWRERYSGLCFGVDVKTRGGGLGNRTSTGQSDMFEMVKLPLKAG